MTMMSRDLPSDLVEEILCRVPATYLKRLKSTCKPWNRLFSGGDSRFARKHRDTAAKQFLVLMLKAFRICPTIVDPLLHGGSVEFKNDLSLVDPQSMDLAQFDIDRVFHCDGLLLCISEKASRFVVWNPVTGETRWFLQRPTKRCMRERHFALGYYHQENNEKSNKILSYFNVFNYYELYEFSSDSWKTLTPDDIFPPGWSIHLTVLSASLKGNTYWFGEDGTKGAQKIISLLKFDFQTEKFVTVPLPYKCPNFRSLGLSAVREEKLSVLLQRDLTSKTEIWVTDKIDDTAQTQVVSWSKVLALDLSIDLDICDEVNFLLDEEKKVVTMRVRWVDIEDGDECKGKDMLYTVGEDEEVTQVELGTDDRCGTWIFNYVSSLAQIKQAGRKRKRGDLVQIEQAGCKRKRRVTSTM